MSPSVWWMAAVLLVLAPAVPAFEVILAPMPGPGGPVTGGDRQPGDVELALDDGNAEVVFGLSQGSAAIQFMWLNHLSTAEALDCHEVRVLFPPGPNITLGAPVDIVVFSDDDADPGNGAQLERLVSGTVQAVDGMTLSSFTLDPPLPLLPGFHLHVGVIPRFITSGITGVTSPAALDTTNPQGQSWFAVWSTDPPASPSLPPDQLLLQVDVFQPGNWIIRLAGTRQVAPEGIPDASWPGRVMLAVALAAAGWVILRRGASP